MNSPYTGYPDLDKELEKLYDRQVRLEAADDKSGALFGILHRQTIASQTRLLAEGKERDESDTCHIEGENENG